MRGFWAELRLFGIVIVGLALAWGALALVITLYGVFIAVPTNPAKDMQKRIDRGECWLRREWNEKHKLWYVDPIPVCIDDIKKRKTT